MGSSPYDENWLLDSEVLDRLAFEIRMNDPKVVGAKKESAALLVHDLCRESRESIGEARVESAPDRR